MGSLPPSPSWLGYCLNLLYLNGERLVVSVPVEGTADADLCPLKGFDLIGYCPTRMALEVVVDLDIAGFIEAAVFHHELDVWLAAVLVEELAVSVDCLITGLRCLVIERALYEGFWYCYERHSVLLGGQPLLTRESLALSTSGSDPSTDHLPPLQ